MKYIFLLVIILGSSGCTALKPFAVATSARLRLYNGRNGGETHGKQSISGNTLHLTINSDIDPKSAKAIGEGLSNTFSNHNGAGEVNQHFTGGGVQAAGGEKASFWSKIFGRKSKTESTPQVPQPEAVKPPEDKYKPVSI